MIGLWFFFIACNTFINEAMISPNAIPVELAKLPLIYEVAKAQSLDELISTIQQFPMLLRIYKFDTSIITTFYDAVLQRADNLMSSEHSTCKLTNLINDIMDQTTEFKIENIKNIAWDKFSMIHFRNFATFNSTQQYFRTVDVIKSNITMDTFHSILHGMKTNKQHMDKFEMDASIKKIIAEISSHQITLDNKFYQELMEVYAVNADCFGATTLMIHLIEKDIAKLLPSIVCHFKKSFFGAELDEYHELIATLGNAPGTLAFVVDIIMPYYGVQASNETYFIVYKLLKIHPKLFDVFKHRKNKQQFAYTLMKIYQIECDFKSAIELLLDCNVSGIFSSHPLWIIYSDMINTVDDLIVYNKGLDSFNDLQYSGDAERDFAMDEFIFYTFHFVDKLQTNMESYNIMQKLCCRSCELNKCVLENMIQRQIAKFW